MRLSRSVVLVTCKVLLTMVLFLAPMSAFADTVSWSIVPGVGSYSYAGGAASLTGNGIGIQSVQDTTTGVFFNIVNGLLSFTTGPNNGLWSWGPAPPGVLNLTGCIDTVTVAGQCTQGSSSLLFSDAFTSAQIVPIGTTFKLALGNITGNLDANLALRLGVSTEVSSGLYNTTAQIGASMGSNFSIAPNLGGSINSDPVPAPEPGTMSLLGAGLIALVGFRKKVLTASV